MSSRLLLTALAVAASVLPASAQHRLTLNEAVKAAVAGNPSLQAADAALAEARLRVTEARARILPRVVFTESWQRSDAPVFAFSALLSARRFSADHLALDALNHPRPVTLFRGALGIEQQWFDRGQSAQVREARLNVTAAEATRDAAAAAIAVATTQTFARIVSADGAETAARAALAAAEEDLSRATRRRDLGLVTDADVLAVSVHRADLEQRAIQAAGDGAIARAELNRLMGTSITDAVDVAEPVDELAPAPPAALTALLAEADERLPEIRRARLQEQLAEAERSRARAALLPALVTQASVDFNGTTFGDRASAWAAGGEVRWSFSLGGAETAALRASAARRTRAQAEAQDVVAQAHVDVVSAYRAMQTARARLVAGASALDQAQEQNRIVRDRFDAGLATMNDVLQASSAALAAEANRTTAMVDVIVSRAQLARAVGRVFP